MAEPDYEEAPEFGLGDSFRVPDGVVGRGNLGSLTNLLRVKMTNDFQDVVRVGQRFA
jgi:hypothetical protein